MGFVFNLLVGFVCGYLLRRKLELDKKKDQFANRDHVHDHLYFL